MENSNSGGRRVDHSTANSSNANPAPQRRRSAKKKKKRGFLHGLGVFFKILGTLFLMGVLTMVMFAWIFMTYVKTSLAPELEVDLDNFTMNLSSTVLYEDDEGNWQELQSFYGEENRIWVDYEDLPKYAIDAVISIEDERFETHHGVDWYRTAGAVVYMFFGMENTFGGSTVTQQVVKNVTENNDPYVKRKVTEIFRALELEKNYSKDDIMEVYLNKVYFGSQAYGLGAAAKTYFGKEVSELTLAECASIVSITNNPSIYGPLFNNTIDKKVGETADGDPIYEPWSTVQWNKWRQETILAKMLELGKITQAEHDQAVVEPLIFVGTPEYEALHANDEEEGSDESDSKTATWSYFEDLVFEDVRRDLMAKYGWSSETATDFIYNAGYTIYSTIDPEIQEIAESVYENVENLNIQNANGEQLQSGITILDPYTGNVVATVGGIGEKTGMRMGSYATAVRPCGSAIKPLSVYAPAIENGIITPAYVYDDYPLSLNSEQTGGYPKNSPNKYRGLVTIETAVKRSSNTVAIRVLQELGMASSYNFMVNNLGFGLVNSDLDEAPLAMGGLTYGVSTLEMAAAYSAFVNDGIYTEPRTYTMVKDANGQVILDNTPQSWIAMKETTAYQINQLLKEVVSSGTGTAARISGMTVAGKTGTTSNNYDRYFVGYTPYYCAAVWVGYGYNTYIRADGNPAANLWQKVMSQVHEGLENRDFHTPSSGLREVTVCTVSGLLPGPACTTHTVKVVEGSGPLETCAMHEAVEICAESGMLASDMCPLESREVRYFINYERQYLEIPATTPTIDPVTGLETYVGTPILAEDEATLLQTVLNAGACTTHDIFSDPNFPGYIDPNDPNFPGYIDPSTPVDPTLPADPTIPDDGTTPGEPTEPNTPAEPEVPTDADALYDWLQGLSH